jgi:hypothetical protein
VKDHLLLEGFIAIQIAKDPYIGTPAFLERPVLVNTIAGKYHPIFGKLSKIYVPQGWAIP